MKKRTYEVGSIVLVRWLDSCLQDGWCEKSEIMKPVNKMYNPISTVGFIAFEDARCLVVAGGWATFDDSYHGAAVIPKVSIQTVDELMSADSFHDLRLGISPGEDDA